MVGTDVLLCCVCMYVYTYVCIRLNLQMKVYLLSCGTYVRTYGYSMLIVIVIPTVHSCVYSNCLIQSK